MREINGVELKELIKELKQKVGTHFKINVFRAVKEFLIKHKQEIYYHYFYGKVLYFIGNKWVFDIDEPKELAPIPCNNMALFCGFTDTSDDTYHYWLKDKKTLREYGITYEDYKGFKSLNWFKDNSNKLYINNKYYKIKGN